MSKKAVIKSGGKQYIVGVGDLVVVDRMNDEVGKTVELETLASFTDDGKSVELGMPRLETKATAQVMETGKGEKIRVAKFKAKVRYRKLRGFRPSLTQLKILSI